MNKFTASIVFAAVAATAALSAQAADLQPWQRAAASAQNYSAQIDKQPGRAPFSGRVTEAKPQVLASWQRAAAADQNFAAQPKQQPGRAPFSSRAVEPATPVTAAKWQVAANAEQNFASQINERTAFN
ncbi:hypothetical protein [Silvimonas iriomotensis]|uniref:Uncharacterized protein n=1 Tax=Silvimonas iriomotensis TaxID=449662 RepID=A0ABQ2PBU4_9NEIS|nr:hypothetical protein [Silvimonas iriomotensis]GGP22687.1 hypothetical protein GCM10010970_26870 [Silvimonas iriomotensis]